MIRNPNFSLNFLSNQLDPPITIGNKKEVFFTSLTQELELECQVSCANPLSLTYRWYADGELIHSSAVISELSHKIKYSLEAEDKDEVREIICIASNGIDGGQYKNDSQIIFELKYKDPNESNCLISVFFFFLE